MAMRRAVAERVRRPWRSDGPIMATSVDMDMSGIRLRLHRPVSDTVLPVMLYIHGGGWTLFSIDTHNRLMREYAERAGIAVLGIDYSLSPEHKFPVALRECSAALDWIAAHAERLQLDAARIMIGGDSAGANLSVATCLLRRAKAKPLPAAMVLTMAPLRPTICPAMPASAAATFRWRWMRWTSFGTIMSIVPASWPTRWSHRSMPI